MLADQADDLVAALSQNFGCLYWRCSTAIRSWASAFVEGRGEARDAGHRGVDLGRGVGEGLAPARSASSRQLVGVETADGRREVTECVGKLIGRGGALQRNRVALRAVTTRGHLKHLGPQQRLGLDRRLERSPTSDVVVDVEGDQSLRVHQRDALDLPDLGSPATCTAAPVFSPPASAKYAE